MLSEMTTLSLVLFAITVAILAVAVGFFIFGLIRMANARPKIEAALSKLDDTLDGILEDMAECQEIITALEERLKSVDDEGTPVEPGVPLS